MRLIMRKLLFGLVVVGAAQPRTRSSDALNDEVFKEEKQQKKVLFGTENGYDTGGTEALCWMSSFSTENRVFNETNHIEKLNNQLFSLANEAKLQPTCYKGTEFSVTPLDLLEDSVMYLDNAYTFELQLTMDISQISSEIDDQALDGVTRMYFRLHVCDAVKLGFCNPIRDTRQIDRTLTREESDLDDGRGLVPFPDDDLKWKYEEGTTLIGIQEKEGDRSKFFGRWCQWKFKEQPDGRFRGAANITLQVPYTDGTALGRHPYLVLGQSVVDFRVGERVLRVDISQAIPEKVVYMIPEPDIAIISTNAKIGVSISIWFLGTFVLGCLIATIRHRSHAIMTTSQGGFLIAMTLSCFVQVVLSFTYLPSRDLFCKIQGPAIMIPLTLIGAILVGRVWRIYCTLAVVNAMGQGKTKKPWVETMFVKMLDVMAALPVCFGACTKQPVSRKSIRRVVTAAETVALICVLTLPQVALQAAGSVLLDNRVETQLTDLENLGREVCVSDNKWFEMTGMGYASLVFLLAVIMAWFSKDLPSAFNEKDQIFNAACVSTVITAMSLGLKEAIDQPTTNPDAVVILNASVSIGIAVSVVYLIVFPKVLRVLSGEKIVVSQMLGSRYSMKAASTTEFTSEAAPPEQAPSKQQIAVGQDDPLPPQIESKIFQVQGLLRCIMNQSGDGRTLSPDDWQRMKQEVAGLKSDLDLVYTVDGQSGENRSRTMI